MEYATYSPLLDPPVENLATTAKETSEELRHLSSLLAFIYSQQRGTFGTLPESVFHMEEDLLQTYIEEVMMVHIGLHWSRQALEHAITNRPMRHNAPWR